MSSLALYLLGPPRVERDGEPVAIARRKAVALLAYLAVSRQDYGRDALATLFWPGHSQGKARAGLRSALWSLTKALGQGYVDVDRERVRLSPDSGVWLDVDEFQDRLNACRRHGHPPDQVCADCLSSLAEAAALYRDDFMAGFTLADSPGFDEWQFFQSEGLRQDLASALERLARGHAEQREYEQAITQARRQVALDPLHEPAQRLLMQLYAWSGQRAAALRQFAECQRALEEELGVLPDEKTTQLYQAIKEKLELPPPTERPAVPTVARAARPKHNLPVQLTPFVGRKAALAEIADLLRDPACRLLTLVGPGGSGKTRLALEAAARSLPTSTEHGDIPSGAWSKDFEHKVLSLPKDGVYFVSLAPLDAADLIVPAVAQALGFTFYGGVEPRQQLLDYLRQRRAFLILDNFEHLIEGADLVTEALKAAPALKILVTSRAVLNVQGEHLFSVPGMELPGQETLDALGYSAVQLFLQGAHRVQPGFEPTGDVLQDVVRICRQVEGMPLGILLAASWVGMLTPAEIVVEIGRSLDFLEADLRDAPQRQRSMRAVFDHSWILLNMRQRAVMKALSVFRGGFTRQAAQQVTGASLRALRTLTNKSLLGREPGGRYVMHELLRQYAAERLGKVPAEKEAMKDRHCAYYAGFLQARKEHLISRNQTRAAVEIEAELENVQSGWRWAVEQAKMDEIAQSLECLAEFYLIRDWFPQGLEMFVQAAQRLAEEWDGRPCPEFVYETASAKAEFARKFETILGKLLLEQGRFCTVIGNVEKARELLQQSLEIFRDLGAQREMAYAMRWLGFAACPSEEGKRRQLQALTIFREIGDQKGIVRGLLGLGFEAEAQGEHRDAQQLFREGLTVSRELGNPILISDSLVFLGISTQYLGQYEEAKQLHQESLALNREINSFFGIATSLYGLAMDCRGLREFEEAEQLFHESLAILEDAGNRKGAALVFNELGVTASEQRDFQEAKRYFQQALKIFITDRRTADALHTLVEVAGILAEEGDKQGALELVGLILHHPASAQRTRDRAATLIAELEVELPTEVVAAALERGQARNLEGTVAELLVELERVYSLNQEQQLEGAGQARQTRL